MGRHASRLGRLLCRLLALAWLAPLGAIGAERFPAPPLPPARPADLVARPAEVPLPPPRPALPATPPGPTSVLPPPAAAAPGVTIPPTPPQAAMPPVAAPVPPPPPDPSVEQLACARLFATGKVVAHGQPALSGPGGCGVAAPISVSAIVVSPTSSIVLKPPVEVNCVMAEAFADWVREDLVPVFAKAGTPLAAITDSSGYQCRGRNRVVGAKLSEHGRGNAIDVGRFAYANGHDLGIKDDGQTTGVLSEVKRTACARFSTVLGPGSDGFHETHLHVDIQFRHGRGKFCHWDRT